jgi:hypothetical protein
METAYDESSSETEEASTARKPVQEKDSSHVNILK